MKNGVFWDFRPCGSYKNRHFEEFSSSFIRVTWIAELGTTLAVTSNRRTLRFLLPWWRRRYVPPKCQFLQEPHGVTSQKTTFFEQICFPTWEFRKINGSLQRGTGQNYTHTMCRMESTMRCCSWGISSSPVCTMRLKQNANDLGWATKMSAGWSNVVSLEGTLNLWNTGTVSRSCREHNAVQKTIIIEIISMPIFLRYVNSLSPFRSPKFHT
jgi:hypothetical protein